MNLLHIFIDARESTKADINKSLASIEQLQSTFKVYLFTELDDCFDVAQTIIVNESSPIWGELVASKMYDLKSGTFLYLHAGTTIKATSIDHALTPMDTQNVHQGISTSEQREFSGIAEKSPKESLTDFCRSQHIHISSLLIPVALIKQLDLPPKSLRIRVENYVILRLLANCNWIISAQKFTNISIAKKYTAKEVALDEMNFIRLLEADTKVKASMGEEWDDFVFAYMQTLAEALYQSEYYKEYLKTYEAIQQFFPKRLKTSKYMLKNIQASVHAKFQNKPKK